MIVFQNDCFDDFFCMISSEAQFGLCGCIIEIIEMGDEKKRIEYSGVHISRHWAHRTRRRPRTPSDLKRLLLIRLVSY